MDANSVDLMRDTASQLRSAIERLKELGRRDLLGELDHAGQQELKELLKLLPQVSRDVREAKKVNTISLTIGAFVDFLRRFWSQQRLSAKGSRKTTRLLANQKQKRTTQEGMEKG